MTRPPSLPPTGEELPEEIVKAIDRVVDAEHDQIKKGSRDAEAWCEAAGVCHQARSTLDATILHHLSAARARAERAEAVLDRVRGDAGWFFVGFRTRQAVETALSSVAEEA